MEIFQSIVKKLNNYWRWSNHQVWNHALWVLTSSLVYGVLFFPLYYFWGEIISVLSIIPVWICSWYFGPMIGVILGVVLTFFDGFLFYMVGLNPIQGEFLTWIAIDLGCCCLTGYIIGRWNEHRYLNQPSLSPISSDVQGKIHWENIPGDFQAVLGSIIAAIPDAVLVTDRNGIVIHWNKAMEVLTGIEAKQVLKRSVAAIGKQITKEDRSLLITDVLGLTASAKKDYSELRQEDQALVLESYFPKFKQGGAYLNLRASPLFNMDGLLVGAILVIQDVTEKRLLQERQALREQRDKTTGLFSTDYLDKEIARLEFRESFPNSVILIRLIRAAGSLQVKDDALTRKFANQLQTFFRVTDTVTYLGDQDFAVLIPKATSNVAQSMAERLRKTMVTQNAPAVGAPVCSIVSVTSMEAGKLKETIQQGRQLLEKA